MSLFIADLFLVACLHQVSRSSHSGIIRIALSIRNNPSKMSLSVLYIICHSRVSHPFTIAQSTLILNMFSQ